MVQLKLEVERDRNQLTLEDEDKENRDWGNVDKNGDLIPMGDE